MLWLWLYLAGGVLSVALGVARKRYNFKRSSETRLSKGGSEEVVTRNVPENVMAILFDLLLWWVPIAFWVIYVPIHDWRAKRAWEADPPPWLSDKPKHRG